ncbi:MAG: response regulator [Anaerolineae bacterium]|nr:response regulator [Anaerolineae bacterium]
MFNPDEFHQQVRDALHHLYDYPYLESHPLALRYWPEVGQRGPGRAHRFSRLLLESIEELNPPGKAAADTSHVRFYSLLVYRFVEERPLSDIMHELGYSRSQFFREQQKAITMLASVLREKLSQQIPPTTEPSTLLDTEAERVLAQREDVDLAEVVRGVLEVVSHLADQHDVALAYDLASELPSFYGSRILLRQVILKGLSNLISQPGTRQVSVRMRCGERRLTIELVTKPGSPTCQPDEAAGYRRPNMEPVQRLAEMMGGNWQGVKIDPEEYVYRFDFPVDNKKTLLVIEDNEGLIRAFQGYLTGYDYLVTGATTGDEALRLAREVVPAVITLDIMMPSQDGWEILQALKSDPTTQSIPVIICSVLEDPELAHSLGAVAYLQKPISQADLLDALDKLSGVT